MLILILQALAMVILIIAAFYCAVKTLQTNSGRYLAATIALCVSGFVLAGFIG